MHALKPSSFPPQPQRPLRTVPRQKTKVKQRPYRAALIETTVKLSVNVVLSAAAIGALSQLLPYRSSQAAKLQELQVTVAATEERVERTQNKFKQYFDPYQTGANMQAQSNRIGTQQRRIVFRRAGGQ
ncbi:hypothetical protein H6F86_06560 [Phormidium sp. FACHB-592]|uniref:Uncharacterized protein n=1 Tax=Stenomitos frigidus AS-A4 TaxID=2933935 RepID=A0ABV0KHY5_9CYAN|nr:MULTISPECIES: hypothetical protein [Cyanophyceae]MBD2036865.1 hypothetical protein [Leptolyngbya sp. FACHB-321]MBD2073554.1 hypothetical protein [Phormidium sp. FACHB-592]